MRRGVVGSWCRGSARAGATATPDTEHRAPNTEHRTPDTGTLGNRATGHARAPMPPWALQGRCTGAWWPGHLVVRSVGASRGIGTPWAWSSRGNRKVGGSLGRWGVASLGRRSARAGATAAPATEHRAPNTEHRTPDTGTLGNRASRHTRAPMPPWALLKEVHWLLGGLGTWLSEAQAPAVG